MKDQLEIITTEEGQTVVSRNMSPEYVEEMKELTQSLFQDLYQNIPRAGKSFEVELRYSEKGNHRGYKGKIVRR